MSRFYKRYVRDNMRYKDEIQCDGDILLRAIRSDARQEDPYGKIVEWLS